jgi:hypothetical protein
VQSHFAQSEAAARGGAREAGRIEGWRLSVAGARRVAAAV